MQEDVTCAKDTITMLTKLLYEKKKLGIVSITDKSLHLQNNIPKTLQDKISSFFKKPKAKDKEDEDMDMLDDSTEESKGFIGHSPVAVKKTDDALMIEQEFEALLNRNIVIRRGRNNRILAKMITKDVFQDDLTDDLEE